MAEIAVFHYIHKDSLLHRMDGRIKLLCLLLFSISATLASGVPDFVVLTAVLAIALAASKLPVMALLKGMKYFAFLIIFIIVVDSFSIPGHPIPGFPLPGVSAEGVTAGLVFSWRLILIIMICTVITGTTSLSTFRNAVEWYLRPVPFIPESRVATMINLTFSLIPVIFSQVSELLDAQKARCIEGRRNPVKRIVFTVFPLLSRTFRRADEVIFAMEARCYSEERTRALFTTNTMDWLVLAFSLLVLAFLLL